MVRLVTIPANCRSACYALHAILANKLVEYHDIAEDVEAMVTVAELNAPILLCDTSLGLLSHLLHVRNVEAPAGRSAASQHALRWLAAKWKPGELSLSAF